MQRIPEPELMDEAQQARAYAAADFEAPHNQFVELFRKRFPGLTLNGPVLDLGCGPGDISLRIARAFPACQVDGVDGAPAMLAEGERAVRAAGLEARVRLLLGYLPGASLPRERYTAVISNSLLHHLADPDVLWREVRTRAAARAPIFVMDLMRPPTPAAALALVEQHAAGEPEILRRDFHQSLLAAYEPQEVREQLHAAGLETLQVEVVSDRHLIIYGYAP